MRGCARFENLGSQNFKEWRTDWRCLQNRGFLVCIREGNSSSKTEPAKPYGIPEAKGQGHFDVYRGLALPQAVIASEPT
ncbi:hypothetical protein JTE90_001446 [Oedothorax gibbosus]|uniref:Uncharacterized protein n=1 Tax=Oedothorax gibbosus TaxID=931172 RepID=A0AAV6V0B0_9ARAC|nr:hypothetical protein JTE90_001446 [Oedothorax gibbosus]